ncbi:unnamed protein product [Clonostachys rhizophaga]|uniref:Prion-inhibition and propagation HeLo domain-containing protein n=1 Tax=Clonostachys rhizophaga TaxID=160324 RepID=A0A9N9W0P8_9HYPO|nr:unnamed protein product [Clonostachys rhizophaga]
MGGPGLGPGSLTLQVVDECVKYYKYFSEASKMPEKHRYLQLRLQLEQQRFLVFVEEAGLLSTEAGFETLSINSTLLQETLSEIKMLFEIFQQANGKYVDIVLPDGHEKKLSPQLSMMELLCATQAPIAKIDISVAPTVNKSLRSDSILKKIIWKARKLRTIMVEPKRLVWVAFDQKAFTSLIANLEVLNSALISLLHSSRSRRINQAVQASYQEIMQMKTDLQGLEAMIQSKTYNSNREEEDDQSAVTPTGSLACQSVTIEARSKVQPMKDDKELANARIHRLDIDQSDDLATPPSPRDERGEAQIKLSLTSNIDSGCSDLITRTSVSKRGYCETRMASGPSRRVSRQDDAPILATPLWQGSAQSTRKVNMILNAMSFNKCESSYEDISQKLACVTDYWLPTTSRSTMPEESRKAMQIPEKAELHSATKNGWQTVILIRREDISGNWIPASLVYCYKLEVRLNKEQGHLALRGQHFTSSEYVELTFTVSGGRVLKRDFWIAPVTAPLHLLIWNTSASRDSL